VGDTNPTNEQLITLVAADVPPPGTATVDA
jgi:hypothetical protein